LWNGAATILERLHIREQELQSQGAKDILREFGWLEKNGKYRVQF
jgi:hypothetical protein